MSKKAKPAANPTPKPEKGFLSKAGTMSEAILKIDLLDTLREFQDNELDRTRFIMLVGIRHDGSALFFSRGHATLLELDGLRIQIDASIDAIIESQFAGGCRDCAGDCENCEESGEGEKA